jgi:hypothetical protein
MTDWATILARHLGELARLNGMLLRAAEARLEAMKRRDVAGIERLMAEERRIGTAVFQEERRRRGTMVRLGAEWGKSAAEMETASLSEVADWLGEPHAGRLLALRDKVHGLAERVQQTNRTMILLAQRLLPCFEELLSVLLDGSLGGRSYTAGGRVSRSGAVGLGVLDVRV